MSDHKHFRVVLRMMGEIIPNCSLENLPENCSCVSTYSDTNYGAILLEVNGEIDGLWEYIFFLSRDGEKKRRIMRLPRKMTPEERKDHFAIWSIELDSTSF